MQPPIPTLKLFGLLLLSIGFVVLGLFIFMQTGIMSKIVALITITFFGFCAITFAIQLSAKGKKAVPIVIKPKNPESILVQRDPKPDEEITEAWFRACKLDDTDLQSVDAVKSECSSYPWSISFGAAHAIREEPYAGILEDTLNKALNAIPGVKNAVREDTEKWVVEGDINGEVLVRAGSVAIDKFLHRYRDKWLAELD